MKKSQPSKPAARKAPTANYKRRASGYAAKKTKAPVKRAIVAHHRHSFKLLPHAHTSYPLLAFLLLLVGVFMAGFGSVASGADYSVNGVVPGIAPAFAADIVSPDDSARFSKTPVAVNGTCPANAYVKLYRNGTFGGVALCQSDGTFSLDVDLLTGANELEARVYNIADQEGPRSGKVTVYYQAPGHPEASGDTPALKTNRKPQAASTAASLANGSAGASVTQSSSNPLLITSEFQYRGHNPGEPLTWQFDLQGGTTPYAVHVDWGDGTTSMQTRTESGRVTFEHTYRRSNGNEHAYTVKVDATDGTQDHAYLQLIALINKQQSSVFGPGIGMISGDSNSTTSTPLSKFLKVAWPTYGVTTLMTASFWLGQHEVLQQLSSKLRGGPKRPRHV